MDRRGLLRSLFVLPVVAASAADAGDGRRAEREVHVELEPGDEVQIEFNGEFRILRSE